MNIHDIYNKEWTVVLLLSQTCGPRFKLFKINVDNNLRRKFLLRIISERICQRRLKLSSFIHFSYVSLVTYVNYGNRKR